MEGETAVVRTGGRCPRCEVCGRAVRVRGVGGEGVWCSGCIGGALPFVGLVGEGEFRGALREYREGLGSRAADFGGSGLTPLTRRSGGPLRGWMGPSGGVHMWEGVRWRGA